MPCLSTNQNWLVFTYSSFQRIPRKSVASKLKVDKRWLLCCVSTMYGVKWLQLRYSVLIDRSLCECHAHRQLCVCEDQISSLFWLHTNLAEWLQKGSINTTRWWLETRCMAIASGVCSKYGWAFSFFSWELNLCYVKVVDFNSKSKSRFSTIPIRIISSVCVTTVMCVVSICSIKIQI